MLLSAAAAVVAPVIYFIYITVVAAVGIFIYLLAFFPCGFSFVLEEDPRVNRFFLFAWCEVSNQSLTQHTTRTNYCCAALTESTNIIIIAMLLSSLLLLRSWVVVLLNRPCFVVAAVHVVVAFCRSLLQ